MKKTLDYRSPQTPPKLKSPSASDGTSLLVLNGLGCGFAILLLLAIAAVGIDPFARFFVFLVECAYLVVQFPLGISSIIYASFLPRSEKRLWVLVAAISATLLGLVVLDAGIWPDRH